MARGDRARQRVFPAATERGPVRARPRPAGVAPPALAGGRLPLPARRQAAADVWRSDQRAVLIDAAGHGGLAAAALANLRNFSLRDATAASYGAGWLRFCAFCARGRYRALPASSSTVGRYVAYLWLQGTVQPSSARTYLSPIRKRHIAAGYPNPCASDLVAEALDGFTNAWLDAHGAKPKRVALPADIAWRLAQLAYASPDRVVRLRLTAVVSHFLMGRRAKDVLNLKADDVRLSADGGLSFQITRSKTDAKRPGGERIAHTYPPTGFSSVPDLPVLLLRRALANHALLRRPCDRLFPAPARDPGTGLSGWLRAGLQMLDVSAPVDTIYASHSCRSGGCTALRTVGKGLDAVAQWAGMTIETLSNSYNDALAVPTLEAHIFFGRLLPRALPLPA